MLIHPTRSDLSINATTTIRLFRIFDFGSNRRADRGQFPAFSCNAYRDCTPWEACERWRWLGWVRSAASKAFLFCPHCTDDVLLLE
jgi:hypothetical protein